MSGDSGTILEIVARLSALGVSDEALRLIVEVVMVRDAGIDPDCWCADCDEARRTVMTAANPDEPWRVPSRFMILCPTCGNKRCPHATSHANACTASNESGQPGSNYGGRPTPPVRPVDGGNP